MRRAAEEWEGSSGRRPRQSRLATSGSGASSVQFRRFYVGLRIRCLNLSVLVLLHLPRMMLKFTWNIKKEQQDLRYSTRVSNLNLHSALPMRPSDQQVELE